MTASGEDLGYVPLEAFLSGKPVLTTEDAGGPLEFVRDGETGLVVAPRPEALGVALRLAWTRLEALKAMGEAGRRRAAALDLGRAGGRLLAAAGPRVSGAADPLRRLAQERGRILGELGVRPDDARWARAEAEMLASLLTPRRRRLRLPGALERMLRAASASAEVPSTSTRARAARCARANRDVRDCGPVVLGEVERLVRADEQLLAVFARRARACRRRRPKRSRGRAVRAENGSRSTVRRIAVGDGERRARRGLREQDRELLAPVAAREVARADGRADDLAESPDRHVPGAVAERVVQPLEVVEIEERDGKRRPVTPVPRPLLDEPCFEVAAGRRVPTARR